MSNAYLKLVWISNRNIVKELNLRIKNWQVDCCICDVLNSLTSNLQAYINFSNNYDSIITTLDKLHLSNPRFRTFIKNANENSGLIPLQHLLQSPLQRIKEYTNILGSLELYTPENHPDHANIIRNSKQIREVHLFVKRLQERLTYRHGICIFLL